MPSPSFFMSFKARLRVAPYTLVKITSAWTAKTGGLAPL